MKGKRLEKGPQVRRLADQLYVTMIVSVAR